MKTFCNKKDKWGSFSYCFNECTEYDKHNQVCEHIHDVKLNKGD